MPPVQLVEQLMRQYNIPAVGIGIITKNKPIIIHSREAEAEFCKRTAIEDTDATELRDPTAVTTALKSTPVAARDPCTICTKSPTRGIAGGRPAKVC